MYVLFNYIKNIIQVQGSPWLGCMLEVHKTSEVGGAIKMKTCT